MNFRCIFGHKYVTIRLVNQKCVDDNSTYSGNLVYRIQKCERCPAEIGDVTGYLGSRSKEIPTDYIRAVYGEDKNEHQSKD